MELLILLAILQVADIWTTLRFLKAGYPEGNPILREMFEEIGPLPTLMPIKAMFMFLAYDSMDHPYWNCGAGFFCGLYLYIVIRNYRVVK